MEPVPEQVATPVPDKEPVLLPPAPARGPRDLRGKHLVFRVFVLEKLSEHRETPQNIDVRMGEILARTG